MRVWVVSGKECYTEGVNSESHSLEKYERNLMQEREVRKKSNAALSHRDSNGSINMVMHKIKTVK